VRSKSIGMLQGLSGRLEATHIRLSGRLHIALQLTHEAPGIKGVYYVSRGCCRRDGCLNQRSTMLAGRARVLSVHSVLIQAGCWAPDP
jgi:hypothetical protein